MMNADIEQCQNAEKQPYVQPTLEEREHLDEVIWGRLLITSGTLPPPP